ncbi:MAG: alpha-2-macroglobulin family protein [Bacteroidales bacterium]|nr:alpha-2-macroglobulin family protein [Bacteroidales bacterium]
MIRKTIPAFFLMLFSFVAFFSSSAQQTGFLEKQWEAVTAFMKQGKPVSALSLVDEIYQEAVENGLHDEQVKAVIFKIRLWSDYQENWHQKAVDFLTEEIATAQAPVQQLLLSLRGEMLWSYYLANRYRILNRTKGETPPISNLATWSYNDFAEAATNDYLLSVRLGKFANDPIEKWDAILVAGEDRALRPTLYDFLAFRALQHFSDNETRLNHSVYEFSLSDPKYLDAYSSFITIRQDSSQKNAAWYSVSLLQELLTRHQNDADPSALIDADLLRLEYVYNNAQFEQAGKRYLNQLMKWFNSGISSDLIAEAGYKAAQYYYNSDPKAESGTECNNCLSLEIIEQVIARYPYTESAKNCALLASLIKEKSLTLNVGEVLPVQQNALALLFLRNTPEAWLRIVEIDPQNHPFLLRDALNPEKALEKYRNIAPLKQWNYSIPLPDDFQPHTAEIEIPPLPVGYYAVLVSSDSTFQPSLTTNFSTFQVSNLAVTRFSGHEMEILVSDRHSGFPVDGCSVSLYSNDYRKGVELIEKGRTNEKGVYVFSDQLQLSYNTAILCENGEDRLFSEISIRKSFYPESTTQKSIHFFTDRAVYRPGQTLFYKAILIERNGKRVVPDVQQRIPVELRDLNNQIRSETTLITNEFGTINGSFVIPVDILTGSIRITTPFGQKLVRVEEYKRPTFELIFDAPVARTDSTQPFLLSGSVMTYSGLPVSGATAVYRVVQREYHPWRWWQPGTMITKEISAGTVLTKDDGVFTFAFHPAEKPKNKAFFYGYTYDVKVTVTDVNGETHEGQTQVRDLVQRMSVKANVPQVILLPGDSVITIEVFNPLGEIEPCTASCTIEQLKAPQKIYRERIWSQKADICLFSETEFLHRFPYDYYTDPTSPSQWPVAKIMMNKVFHQGELSLRTKDWKGFTDGTYRITIVAVSPQGEKTTFTREFVVITAEGTDAPVKEVLYMAPLKPEYVPGDTVRLLVSSAKRNFKIHYFLTVDGEKIDNQVITLNNSRHELLIPVKESYRGDIFITLYGMIHNRQYEKNIRIHVPYTNKKLKVDFLTFRDKTEPGKKETWELKISDFNGNGVSSELLITLYDKSLDAIAPLNYTLNLYPDNTKRFAVNGLKFGLNYPQYYFRSPRTSYPAPLARNYDRMIWQPSPYGRNDMKRSMQRNAAGRVDEGMPVAMQEEEISETLFLKAGDQAVLENASEAVVMRRDFRETGFFYPTLYSDHDGKVTVNFKAPESVTGWKVAGVAHTQDLKTVVFENELVTQKELMVIPNLPRFVREGDKLVVQAKLLSLIETALQAETMVTLFNAVNGEVLEGRVAGFNRKVVQIDPNGTAQVEWSIMVPYGIAALGIKITATGGLHTDGEEHILPVLPLQTLVTESRPISVHTSGTHEFVLEGLKNSSMGARHYAVTLEYTANPAWYAVQALPYLETEEKSTPMALFNTFYSNALASYIASYNPDMQQLFALWAKQYPEALTSPLEKNQKLKRVLLHESPWLLDARNETDNKRKVALLFDENHMAQMKIQTWNQILRMQHPDGGWPWFEGMRTSRLITLFIVESSARLFFIGAENSLPQEIIRAAGYLDSQADKEYREWKDSDNFDPEKNYLSPFIISWMYARSLLGDQMGNASDNEWYAFSFNQIKKHWRSLELYQQSLAAMILYLNVDPQKAQEIIASLKERAIYSDELGMYWRELTASPYWHRAPVETMASLIETFSMVGDDETEREVAQMKQWLLMQKQTNRWSTDVATAHAVYALLLQGDDITRTVNEVSVVLGGKEVVSPDSPAEPGTGYIRKVWHGGEITQDMGTISLTTTADALSYGALYWQYYSDLDKIGEAGNGLTVTREVLQKVVTPQGERLVKPANESLLNPGDKVVVRMVVTADRDFSFVHLKDLRTAAYEPVDLHSGYRYGQGAGYYYAVKDASVNFYFDRLAKGTYVFEYSLFKVINGTFRGGLTTVQCMYAPEFGAHSAGSR